MVVGAVGAADVSGGALSSLEPHAPTTSTAAATITAPADIFTTLERKLVDATEYITPSSNISQGFHKIARYIIVPGVHAPGNVNEVVWKAEVWDGLPKGLRDKLEYAGRLAGLETYLRLGMADIEAMKEMKKGRNEWVTLKPELGGADVEAAGSLTAPMPGRIVKVMTTPGAKVDKGDALLILEAMKMEHTITAPKEGTVKSVHYAAGEQVLEGAELVSLE